ncbi:Uncharacterised protein [Providencia rustigianii]|uniref:Oligosaccharide repeat unit polymerase n=1 Tax=Providencia rustigianii TaxID=158850 RepID=A0A379G8E3_9GAMM|nr:oligosaccharide repeat unit polymerase [Providencia rustigianii]SUC37299.1 Uncharacterised protein [Providencia rustigianii]
MRISPATLIIFIYLFSNILLGANYGYTGILGGDFINIEISDSYWGIYFFELVCILLFLLLLRLAYLIVKPNKHFIYKNKSMNIFIFIIQTLFLIYSYTTGVGQLSENFYEIKVDNPIKYIFTFLNPDYLFLASLCIDKKNNKANIALYLFSNLYRGWIAGALFSIFMIIISKRYSKHGIKLKYIPILLILFFTAAPSIYYVKYITRGAESIERTNISDYYSQELYNKILNAALSRFQHVSETYCIVENIDIIRLGNENSDFVPFYFETPAKNILSKVFDFQNNISLTQYSAEKILGKSPGNIHVGIAPWLIITPWLTLIYILSLLFSFVFLAFLLKKMCSGNAWTFCVWISITLAMHGWFSSYYTFIWSFFVIFILNKINLGLTKTNKA